MAKIIPSLADQFTNYNIVMSANNVWKHVELRSNLDFRVSTRTRAIRKNTTTQVDIAHAASEHSATMLTACLSLLATNV